MIHFQLSPTIASASVNVKNIIASTVPLIAIITSVSGTGRQQEDLVTGLVVLGQWLGAAGVRRHLLPPIHKVLGKPSQTPMSTTDNLSSTSQQLFPQHIHRMFGMGFLSQNTALL